MRAKQPALTTILTHALMIAGAACLIGALCAAATGAPRSLAITLAALTPALMLASWVIVVLLLSGER